MVNRPGSVNWSNSRDPPNGQTVYPPRGRELAAGLEEAVKAKPFGRLIDPNEVARACAYLASDESGLMTGANIDFDQNVMGAGDAPLDPNA